MNHFKNHRRKLTKSFNVRGYEKSVHSDGDTISLPSSSGILRELKIQGKAKQENYQSQNVYGLVKKELSGCELQADGSINITSSGACIDIFAPVGNYTLTFNKSFTNSCWLRNGRVGSGYIAQLGNDSTEVSSSFAFTEPLDGYLRIHIYTVGVISDIQLIYHDVTPNSDFFVDIVSAGAVKIRGTNLFDINKIYTVSGAANNGDGTFTVTNYPSMFGYLSTVCPDIRVGDTVYFYYDTTSDAKQLYISENKKYYNSGDSFTVESEEMLKYRLYLYSNRDKTAATVSNFRVVYEKKTPFEPYIEPITVADNKLYGIDGYNDILTVDCAEKPIKLNKKVKSVYIKDLHPGDITVTESNGYYGVEIRNLTQWRVGTKAYCTHCKMYDSENYTEGQMCFELTSDGYLSTLYFYNTESATVDEFIAYASESNLMIAYVMESEENTELEYNLSSEILPYNATAVIEAENANGIDVIYYSLQE